MRTGHSTCRARHVAFILTTASYTRTFPLAFARLLRQLNVQTVTKPFDIDELLAVLACAQERLAQAGEQGAAE